jgi:hypothetical protein
MRVRISGDLSDVIVIGEEFIISGHKDVFAVHPTQAWEQLQDPTKLFAATHVETGARFYVGRDIDEVITEARKRWLSKSPEELAEALSKMRARRAELDAERLQ